MLALATKIVGDYGKVLAQVEPGVYGLPESLLPHSRERLQHAILTLLSQLDAEHVDIKQGLRQGYVYLSQFVSDEDAAIASRGQASVAGGNGDDSEAEPAMRIINRIKLDMERALEDLSNYP
ncbi:MAG: hypothetical protein ABIY56_03825 [Dokdonella sp.]